MRPDFRTFQYSSGAKIPIHHGARTDRKGRIDRKQAYSRKNSKFDPGHFFVDGAHRHIQDTFNEGIQYTVEKNPGMDTNEGFDKLEPRYRLDVINRYQCFIEVS